MRSFESAEDVQQLLLAQTTHAKHTRGPDTIARTARLLAHAGLQRPPLRVVHVAGTSGKTSTTTYIAALLTATGRRVGHTSSPHITSITERVQINGQQLDTAAFCAYSARFLELIKDYAPQPTWQEFFTAFAIWVFVQERVDYAVLETAVGGRYDATNAVVDPHKLCVITDIGYDHLELLGNTLATITRHKAGIIHPGNTVLMHRQVDQVNTIIQTYAACQHATLHLTRPSASRSTMPRFQQRNWDLAYAAYKIIARRDHLPDLHHAAIAATQATPVPGRMETIRFNGTTVILDGAHNPQKMAALTASLAAAYPDQRLPVLLAIKDSKDVAATVAPLQAVASVVIATAFPPIPSIHTTAVDTHTLVQTLQACGIKHVSSMPDPVAALNNLLQGTDGPVLVTGSFYLLATVRSHLLQTHPA